MIKFEWGEAKLTFMDIIDIVDDTNNNNEIGNWEQYPQNICDTKSKAAGILGTSAVIAKALGKKKDSHIEQLLQHLVLLQSQKVKFSTHIRI